MDGEGFTLAAVLTDLGDAPDADRADAVEFRMDLADDPLEQLAGYASDLPIIATNRASWEGGAAEGPERLETLAAAAEAERVAAVDVELESVRTSRATDVLATARDNDTLVIVSWHDFDATPSRAQLRRRLHEAADVGDVAKAAVTAAGPGDVLDLLTVTYELSQEGVAVATMSMGVAGRHSRVIAPLYGSRIGYAPVDPAEATAPGQYDLATLADLLDAVR